MTGETLLADRIVDCALELAEKTSWESLSLHRVAAELGITLEEVRRHFAVKDDLVEAWYDRADRAMLRAAQQPAFETMSHRRRLHTLVMAWLDALAARRTVSRDMLLYKLEPAHVHLQIQGLLRISATVQWLRDAARLDATHLQRIAEEIGLSTIFVATFVHWMRDGSPRQQRTRAFLERHLARAERLSAALFPRGEGGTVPARDEPSRE